jgi:hypothetical protein
MNLGLLIHHHATVYIKRLSSDVVGRWRREENHRLGDIFGLAHAGNGQPLNAGDGHLTIPHVRRYRRSFQEAKTGLDRCAP